MTAKQLFFRDAARVAMLRGVEKLAKAVKATLGPKGRNALLDRKGTSPAVTKDGVSVARELDLPDPYESMAVRLVRETALKTGEVAGDGTTTAVVLAEAVYREGVKHLAAGASPMEIKRGLDRAVEVVTAVLQGMSQPCRGTEAVARAATLAANGDEGLGRIVAEALDRVGQDGVVTIEDGRGLDTSVEIVQGLSLDRGYLSPAFVLDQDRLEIVLERPYLLMCDRTLTALRDLVPVLELVAKQQGSLLIIAGDVQGEALAGLVVNHLKRILPVVAVKAPDFGQNRKDLLEDLAVMTGGRAVLEELGASLPSLTLNDLGRAKRVTVTKDRTTFIEGEGDVEAIKTRIATLKARAERADSDHEREALLERAGKLGGGVAVIRIGAATETELTEKKARLDDALHAARAAIEEGLVPGGGVALVRCLPALAPLDLPGDEQVGVRILQRAIEEPLRQIAENAGISGTVVLDRVRTESGAFGFDAASGSYADLRLAGILDPTKVVRTALRHAVSVAGLMLTTEVLITEQEEEEDDQPNGTASQESGETPDLF